MLFPEMVDRFREEKTGCGKLSAFDLISSCPSPP